MNKNTTRLRLYSFLFIEIVDSAWWEGSKN